LSSLLCRTAFGCLFFFPTPLYLIFRYSLDGFCVGPPRPIGASVCFPESTFRFFFPSSTPCLNVRYSTKPPAVVCSFKTPLQIAVSLFIVCPPPVPPPACPFFLLISTTRRDPLDVLLRQSFCPPQFAISFSFFPCFSGSSPPTGCP